MKVSFGTHGAWFGFPKPGFDIPTHKVSELYCRENISITDAPHLVAIALDHYVVDSKQDISAASHVLGQTAIYLLALMGPDVLVYLPDTTGQASSPRIFAMRAARMEVVSLLTGSVFAQGMPEHSRMQACLQRERR